MRTPFGGHRGMKVAVAACVAAVIMVCLAFAFAQQRRRARPATTPASGQRTTTATARPAASKVARSTPGTINVKAGDNLQAALDEAIPGDTLLLEAGATFRGTFNLPNKGDSESFITLRSSAPDAQLPAPGERLDPARYASLLPKIMSKDNGAAAIITSDGAHHYRFVAIDFGPTPDGANNIVALGTTNETSLIQLPHHLEFDRTYFHGDPAYGQRRGIALNCRDVRVVNSYFADFKRKGEESQALAGWNGPGPFEIVNNYIEAAAEGVIFGGSTTSLKVVPSDIVVRGNHFNKPLAWRNEGWVVKNHFELKNARRVVIDGNLMTNVWTSGQEGTAVLFTVRDEDRQEPQATIEDVLFINNRVVGAGGAFNVYGSEGRGGHRLTIRNNVFGDINGAKWASSGKFLKITSWDNIIIENNTVLTTGNITSGYGSPTTGFVFRNNIIPQNEFGFHGDGHAPGIDSLNTYFPGHIVTNNAIIGGTESLYKGRNMYPASLQQIKFNDAAKGDYRLRPDSPLRKAGFGGADIGANPDVRVPVQELKLQSKGG